MNYIGKFDAPSFWMFHFINGEETKNGIEIEFLKYPNEVAQAALDFFRRIPEFAYRKDIEPVVPFHTVVSKITIDLNEK